MRPWVFFSVLFLWVSTHAFAVPSPAIERMFAERFASAYTANQCDGNAYGLAQEARRSGYDLSGAYVIVVERRTWCGVAPCRIFPREPRLTVASERGWFYHSFLVTGDRVLDFDFTAKALPIGVGEYVLRMFDGGDRDDLALKYVYDLGADAFLLTGDQRANNAFRIRVGLNEFAANPARSLLAIVEQNRALGTLGRYRNECGAGAEEQGMPCRIVERVGSASE